MSEKNPGDNGAMLAARIREMREVAGMSVEELAATLELPAEELLTGVLHNRLGRVLVKASGISGKNTTDEFSAEELDAVVRSVKSFEIILTDPMGMENAQVTAGGVQTSGFDSKTMESKLIPGLYACGEVLDVDGDCGGFNLQWAWSSGYIAGKAAGGSL